MNTNWKHGKTTEVIEAIEQEAAATGNSIEEVLSNNSWEQRLFANIRSNLMKIMKDNDIDPRILNIPVKPA